MTLEELIDKVPEAVRPAVAKYGPGLLAMSTQELWDWIELLMAGRTRDAMLAVYARMPNGELFAAMSRVLDDWDKANAENAQRIALAKEAALAILRALFTAALALVAL